MNNKFKKINDILNINLRPWLDINKSDKKFINITKDFSPIDYDFQNLYQIDFFPSFNDKTKYYYKLINNEAIEYCNEIYNLINKNDDLKYQKFLLNDTLNKKLKTKLSEIAKLINERKYNNIDSIDPYKTSPLIDEDLKTETYIIQLLKITLVKIYLEIQNLFPFINKDDILFENDFYSTFFSEPIPKKSFLQKIKPPKIITNNSETTETTHFPKEHIFHSFKYKNLKFDSDKLNDLFDSLKKNNFISDISSLINFKKIFYGDEISSPIIWIGNKSELYYFIHLIYTKYKLVEDLKQKQWKVTCKCFIRPDKSKFTIKELKYLKKPNLTYNHIEKAVNLLK